MALDGLHGNERPWCSGGIIRPQASPEVAAIGEGKVAGRVSAIGTHNIGALIAGSKVGQPVGGWYVIKVGAAPAKVFEA